MTLSRLSLHKHIRRLQDPRLNRRKRHLLGDILTIDVQGALVSIDAMGCQKAIAAKIVAGGGDYVLTVKDNQEHLRADIEACFSRFSHARRRTFSARRKILARARCRLPPGP